jgi:putative FmdB family regulatory protein
MPLYEYQCDACGTRIEKIQKFSDPPPESCEACGGAMRKLPSSPAIQFKGSGWYITDYAKKTAVEGTRSADPKAGDAGKGGSATADSGGKADTAGKGTAGASASTAETGGSKS